MDPEASSAEALSEEESSGGIAAGELFRFIGAAFRRHLLLATLVALVVAVVGVTVALLLPPVFESHGKILVKQGGTTLRILSNPGRAMTMSDPLSDAPDVILSKTNLLELAKQVKLLEGWEAARDPKGRALDWLRTKISGPIADEDKEAALAGMLEQKMQVYPEGKFALNVRVYWGEPLMAAQLVEVAMQRFMDRRLEEETSVIRAAIDVLERELKQATTDLGPALAGVQHATTALRDPSPQKTEATKPEAATSAPVALAPPPPPQADPELGIKLAEVRQQIAALQQPWQRDMQDLKAKLQDLRGVYGPEHPSVIQATNRLQEASVEPSDLADLRDEERRLSNQLRDAASTPGNGEVRQGFRRGGGKLDIPSAPALTDSPELTRARSTLASAMEKYNEVNDNLEDARLEVITAEVAFKYRYNVLDKPEPPRTPLKPNRPLLIAASLAAALLLAFISGGAKELATGRFVDVWQVRQLGLPLLAEIGTADETET